MAPVGDPASSGNGEKDLFMNGHREAGVRSFGSGARICNETVINIGEDDEMKIIGYRVNNMKRVILWIFTILSLMTIQLVMYWRPHWRVWLTCDVCTLDVATVVILGFKDEGSKVADQYGQYFVEEVIHGSSVASRLMSESSVKYSSNSDRHGDSSQATVANEADFSDASDLSLLAVRYFYNKKLKYCWSSERFMFEKLKGPENDKSCSYFHQCKGLTCTEEELRRKLYGDNSIRVHVMPILTLLFTQVLNPFYIFQVLSCTLWFLDSYYYFAGCIIIISALSIIIQIRETRQTQRTLKNTIATSGICTVYRPDKDDYEDIQSDSLAPGDIIEIPRHGCMLQCDAVLIAGNCIVNESMLTGESVPVTKTPVPDPQWAQRGASVVAPLGGPQDPAYNAVEHSRHTLFCGTKVIQTRYYGNQRVRAVVTRTGFMTAKGELVRSIMFPKPVDFKFKQDSFKFIAFLACLAAVGMIYTLTIMIIRGDSALRVFVRTLDLATIIIPPSLPAAMTVGIVFAQKRLKRQLVFCISPRSINLCGALDVLCFDKTGTLTEDGLDMWGVVPAVPTLEADTGSTRRFDKEEREVELLPEDNQMVIAMATCHSLTMINNELTGDPMDLKMFDSTGWELYEPGEDTSRYDTLMPTMVKPKPKPDPRSLDQRSEHSRSRTVSTSSAVVSSAHDKEILPVQQISAASEEISYEYGILRQFTFSSKLQRMSVVVRRLGCKHFELYAKGSPEMITSLSKPETVPADMQEVLMSYTQKGFRVLALAHKKLKLNYVKVQRVQREAVECKLTFLGLVILENQLKPQSKPAIQKLKDANIRTVMVTGDNMLTALSVARDCNMIGRGDQVILVTATNHLPPNTNLNQSDSLDIQPSSQSVKPSIQYTYAADTRTEEFDLQTPPCTNLGEISLTMGQKSSTHFAVMGKSWSSIRKHYPEIIPKLVVRGTVFARFSPDEKQQLIESLQELGYYVGMCGDGANDCGALKTAHAGISLSEAEASVASPFTSKQANISCVLSVIREGRAALVTSFGIFKFMAGYSLTQFMSVCLLYWVRANLSDIMFLYIDLALQTSLSITFCYTRAYEEIVPIKPKISLIALTPILSLVSQLLINISFQFFAWMYTTQQPWFEPFVLPPDHIRDFTCHEVTAVFTVSAFQYVILAVVFSKGVPYRKPLITNWLFLMAIVISVCVTSYCVLIPADWVQSFIQLRVSPSVLYRFFLVGLAALNFFISLIVEMFVIDILVDRKCDSVMKHRQRNKYSTRHEEIEAELSRSIDWPPAPSISHHSLAEIMRLEVGQQCDESPSHPSGTRVSETGSDSSNQSESDTERGEPGLMERLSNMRPGRRKRGNSSSAPKCDDDDTVFLVPENS